MGMRATVVHCTSSSGKPSQHEWLKGGRSLAVFMAYAGVAVCTTWPLVARLASHLPDGSDTLLHYGNGWWVWQALRSGQSPFYTPYLFFPTGISMVYNNFAWLHILPWIALRPLIGGIAAYNVLSGWRV